MFEYFIAPDNVTITVLMIQKSWRSLPDGLFCWYTLELPQRGNSNVYQQIKRFNADLNTESFWTGNASTMNWIYEYL